jgi:hypothetical protein
MRPIAMIAAAQLKQGPEFSALRMPPANVTSRRLIAAAGAMVAAATNYASAFTSAGMRADFLEQLTKPRIRSMPASPTPSRRRVSTPPRPRRLSLGVWRQDMENTKDKVCAEVKAHREEAATHFDRVERRLDAIDHLLGAASERAERASRRLTRAERRLERLEASSSEEP